MPWFLGSKQKAGEAIDASTEGRSSSTNAVASPKSLTKSTYIDGLDGESSRGDGSRLTDKGALGGEYLPPANVFAVALRWMLFDQPVFAPGRDVATEKSYLRTRGAANVQWRSDASFRAVHSAVGAVLCCAFSDVHV